MLAPRGFWFGRHDWTIGVGVVQVGGRGLQTGMYIMYVELDGFVGHVTF
jgi:hypothetical protein